MLRRVRRAGQVAAGRVQDALRLAGRAARVQREQRVLAVERSRLVLRRRRRRPRRATTRRARATRPGSRSACTTSTVFDRAMPAIALSTLSLSGTICAAPPAAVGGDHDLAPCSRAIRSRERLRREAAEHDRVRRADPRAREHRDRGLGDHRQVDRDEVARADAERGQRVRRLAHLAVQLAVGQHARVAGLALEHERRLVLAPRRDVAIEAVHARVELCRRRTTSRRAASSRAPASTACAHASSPAISAQNPSGSPSRARVQRLVLGEALDVRVLPRTPPAAESCASRSAPNRSTTIRHVLLLRSDDRDRVDLDARVARQPRRLHRRARRRIVREPLAVDRVHRREVVHVARKIVVFTTLREARAGRGEHRAEVRRAPAGSAPRRRPRSSRRFRVERDLAAAEDHPLVADRHRHRLRVRPDRGRRLRGPHDRLVHVGVVSQGLTPGRLGC